MSKMLYFVKRKVCLLLSKKCRPIYCILLSPNVESFIWTRYICSWFVGVCVGAILWLLISLNFNFSLESEVLISVSIAALVGIGFVFTTNIKCISFLILAGMAGKSGRSYLRALCFAYIITGPIFNLASNGGEVVRVFACATTLTYNLTKTRLDLMTKPFHNTLTTIKDDFILVEKSFDEFNGVLQPIRTEVSGTDNDSNLKLQRRKVEGVAERVQKNYSEKIKTRCKRQLKRGERRCRDAFENAYLDCNEKFPRVVKTLLCWPFQVDFICHINLLGKPDKICDPYEALPKNFGESYAQLDDSQKLLYGNNSHVEVKYKIKSPTPKDLLRNADHTADLLMNEFNAKRKMFDVVMNITQKILSILFIKVIIAALYYHKKYLGDINFDNVYISEYFHRVDDRRKRAKKSTVLPLKKFEKKNLVDLKSAWQHTEQESRAIYLYLFQFAMEILAASLFLLLDYLIVTLLEIIRIKSFVSYTQKGEHIIHFQVEGSGLMARLLRRTLHNFNIHAKVSTYLSNETCLPNPNILSKSSYFMRLRRLICSYFYYKREKKRILYLYNNILRRRRTLFSAMRKTATSNVVKQKMRQRYNLILRFRLKWPKCCRWLRCLPGSRFKCLICNDLEDNDFIICKNPQCRIGYCYQCWRDLGVLCIACQTELKSIEILDFYTFFEIV
ncbi:E3 ubiquitin-protein ligase DCST1 isoform X2 [Ceratitis capitata]|uniref:E3 ubiquitin-protein ligase DCST1 isoform X2 n=1 Tax=Ceratitis capitata TaxID=7213 RepID=UPI000A0F95A8|nr:E3 ubiquitin-protein ligase DCST1 isoform X2 [Ceratitis capitata]